MSEASSGSPSAPDPRLYPQQPIPPQQYGAPGGYGYPQQQAQPPVQQPAQPMYAQQPPQGAPAFGGGAPQGPDWAGMADDYERTGKRKRMMMISGAAAAGLVVIGGVVWFGLSGGKPSHDAGPTTPTAVASSDTPVLSSPSPSAPPTHLPPVVPADVYAKTSLTIDGKTFTRTADDSTDPCWKASQDGLGTVLDKNGCAQVLRGTYASGNHAVTVAVAVFHSKADAEAAASAFVGKVTPLYGNNVDSFCVGKAGCEVTHAVSGRFLYIAESGQTGNSASKPDALSGTAGRAAASYVLSSLLKIEQSS